MFSEASRRLADEGPLSPETMISQSATVIVPVLNEARYVEQCIRSLVHDHETEVLVVDGGSSDSTVAICEGLKDDFPALRVIDNSARRTAAAAMNLGVAEATRDVIVRVDAHSVYSSDYLGQLVSTLRVSDAWVTGGHITSVPRRPTVFGRAVAASLNSRFVMGGAKFRGSVTSPVETDSVPFGCYRRDVFSKVGSFNEALARSQDYDFFQRVRAAGGKVLLVPGAEIVYQARSGVMENIRYNFWNGYWITYPRIMFDVRFSWRHYAPLAAALLAAIVCLVSLSTTTVWPVAVIVAVYLAVLAGAVTEARSTGPRVALMTGVVALMTHSLYAAGCLWGCASGWRRRLRAESRE